MQTIEDLGKFPSENPNPVLRLDAAGAVLYANAAAGALDGLFTKTKGGLFSRPLVDAAAEAFRSGATQEADFAAGPRLFTLTLTPVPGEQYVNVYGRDVTEERRAQQRSRELAKFPSENPNPVLRVDPQGQALYANDAAQRLVGLLEREDAQEMLTAGLAASVARAFTTVESVTADLESGERTYALVFMPVPGEQYINVYGRDVTAERRAHAEIVAVKNFNENVLQNLSNGVITLDGAQRITKVNRAARRILGRDNGADLVGVVVSDLLGPTNQWVLDSLAEADDDGQPHVQLDREIDLGNGERVSVNVTAAPLASLHQHAKEYMLVLEDITREKRIKGTMVRFMSDRVVEQLLDLDETLLGGATQEVTILFADIRNFTGLSERLGAREMVAVLNDYFALMVDVIFKHGGTLDKFIGDAIMAVFGAPFVAADDTDNAVATAIEMLARLREFNQRQESEGRSTLKIGVGIDTGEVVAGTIGSPRRMDYTVIGDHVNVASRVESANKYYGTRILVTEHTQKRLRKDHRVREIDKARVIGRDGSVTLFEILDYHDDDSFPNIENVLAAYEQGLAHYRAQEWDEGAAHFAEALRGNPNDRPTQIFLDRCWTLKARPPHAAWTGITDFTDFTVV
jgi:PAS domain S-box-containing protein